MNFYVEVCTMLKRILSIALFLCLFCVAAGAEIPLPIDFSGGSSLSREGYTAPYTDADGNTVCGYTDSTITVTIVSGHEARTEYWVADIVISDASQLRTKAATSFDSNDARDPLRMAQEVNAVLAVNGDYNNAADKHGMGYIIRQGIMYRNHLEEEDTTYGRLMDVLLIDEDGDFHIFYRPTQDSIPETINGKRIINAFTFGPCLVDNGELITDYHRSDRSFVDMDSAGYKQRICICQAGPLHYKVIACSGPSLGSKGMTMSQFADLVWRQGVQVAYNLDGGNSATIALCGKRANGSGHEARKLLDIIYFASAQ